jgi:DNA-binding CsgD family transcriptional regulator
MLVFNSEMHLLTFIFIVLEFGFLCINFAYYLNEPLNRRRFWYMTLLFLLIIYNIAGGLFPDPEIPLSIITQNILAYGSGFLMASYFPFYFYKAFKLKGLRFHAYYGVLYFLLFPYFLFFVIIYPVTGDLDFAISYGMIVPFLYSLVILYIILTAIGERVEERRISPYPYSRVEMCWVYAAVLPWVALTVISYFQLSQWIEVLVTNSGFVLITILFIGRSAKVTRIRTEKLMDFYKERKAVFESCAERYKFTNREAEISVLLCQGLTYKEIGDRLFITEKTVGTHIQHLFFKAGATRKIELMQKLGLADDSLEAQ